MYLHKCSKEMISLLYHNAFSFAIAKKTNLPLFTSPIWYVIIVFGGVAI